MRLIPAALAAVLIASPAAGQSTDRLDLEQRIVRCFNDENYSRAAELIEDYLRQSPNDATMLYNLACARSRMNDADAAAAALLRAFKAGFRDASHMRRDPDLAALREHPIYRRIMEEADRSSATRTANALDQWRETYGTDAYRYETDRERRIAYATALDEVSHREMREMLEQESDQAVKLLFEHPPAYDVLIAVPTPADADKFFSGDRSIGGIYQHDLRRLVARDIGGSLRHEFLHALHYGHMEQLGQPHALWVQEGLACLFEDYELDGDGTIRFVPNDRQIIVRSRARAGRLTKWSDLFAMSSEAFMDRAPRMYPEVRSIFEFVADQGKLGEWYRAYVTHFDEDRTGAAAFEAAFGKPAGDVEREWRKWVLTQRPVNLQIRPESAALGIRTREHTSNDGVAIGEVVAGSAAARAGLRRDDVIVSIDDRSTRSLMELRKIVASHAVGDEVEVRVRRSGEYLTVRVALRPLFGGS